jgi:uncharacterized membrane protein YfcA
MHALGLALAVIVGLSLGLLGGGGSILTVPIFVYVLGFAAKQAIAMSLPVVGATSLVGALRHWRSGNVQVRLAFAFGGAAMVGAYAGAKLAALISARVQLTLLAIAMLAAAASMFRSGRVPARDRSTQPAASPVVIMMVGVGVGLLTGMIGIGGGFLVVPALVVLAGVPMTQAIGTSLVVITMNSLSGSIGYIGQFAIPWSLVAAFTALSIVGILIGTHLVRFVSQAALKQGFAGFLVLLGALILIRSQA